MRWLGRGHVAGIDMVRVEGQYLRSLLKCTQPKILDFHHLAVAGAKIQGRVSNFDKGFFLGVGLGELIDLLDQRKHPTIGVCGRSHVSQSGGSKARERNDQTWVGGGDGGGDVE